MNRQKHILFFVLGVVVPFLCSCGSGESESEDDSAPEIVVPEIVVPESSVPVSTMEGSWLQEGYDAALVTMGATELISTYTGAGTAVVQFEQSSPFLNAEITDSDGNPTGAMPFGECDNSVTPSGHTDSRGWAPGGANCKVAWVMCFASASRDDDPTGTSDLRYPYCAGSPVPGVPSHTQVNQAHHATSVANGVATIAPGARIIVIQIHGGRSLPYKLAVEWLVHPSSDLDWYLANGYTADEANYYNQVFGGLSPAKHWNVVATTGSLNGLFAGGGLQGVFSKPCSFAANPEPELGLDYDEYLLDWHTQYHSSPEENFLRDWESFDSHSQLLKDAGIMPFFATHNALYTDSAGDKFISPNGVGFPACLGSNYAVSGIPTSFLEKRAGLGNHYIGTNASPTMTDFLAPAGASSFAAPVVAASVAVLKSSNLHPNATINEVIAYLKETELAEGPSNRSCRYLTEEVSFASAQFPAAAHPSLNCTADPYYTLPVLHLGAAIGKARARLDSVFNLGLSGEAGSIFNGTVDVDHRYHHRDFLHHYDDRRDDSDDHDHDHDYDDD